MKRYFPFIFGIICIIHSFYHFECVGKKFEGLFHDSGKQNQVPPNLSTHNINGLDSQAGSMHQTYRP